MRARRAKFSGCIATGATREEAEQNMYKAIEMHVKRLREDNLPIPKSSSFAEYVAVRRILCYTWTLVPYPLEVVLWWFRKCNPGPLKSSR